MTNARLRGGAQNRCVARITAYQCATDTTARGLEAWYSRGDTLSAQFASCLLEQVAALTGSPVRTIKTTDQNRWDAWAFSMTRWRMARCSRPASSPIHSMRRLLKDPAQDIHFADGLYRGIRKIPWPLTRICSGRSSDSRQRISRCTDGAWYSADVKLCLEEQLFVPPSDGLFHPERPVTRARSLPSWLVICVAIHQSVISLSSPMDSLDIGLYLQGIMNQQFMMIAALTFFGCEAVFAFLPIEQARFKQLTALVVGGVLGLLFQNGNGPAANALIQGVLAGGATTMVVAKFKKPSVDGVAIVPAPMLAPEVASVPMPVLGPDPVEHL